MLHFGWVSHNIMNGDYPHRIVFPINNNLRSLCCFPHCGKVLFWCCFNGCFWHVFRICWRNSVFHRVVAHTLSWKRHIFRGSMCRKYYKCRNSLYGDIWMLKIKEESGKWNRWQGHRIEWLMSAGFLALPCRIAFVWDPTLDIAFQRFPRVTVKI